MRDGVRLYTIIVAPKISTARLPFMLLRTPYSAAGSVGNPFPTEYVGHWPRTATSSSTRTFAGSKVAGRVRDESAVVERQRRLTRQPIPTTPSNGCSRMCPTTTAGSARWASRIPAG